MEVSESANISGKATEAAHLVIHTFLDSVEVCSFGIACLGCVLFFTCTAQPTQTLFLVFFFSFSLSFSLSLAQATGAPSNPRLNSSIFWKNVVPSIRKGVGVVLLARFAEGHCTNTQKKRRRHRLQYGFVAAVDDPRPILSNCSTRPLAKWPKHSCCCCCWWCCCFHDSTHAPYNAIKCHAIACISCGPFVAKSHVHCWV